MPTHSPGLQEQGTLLIRSTLIHSSPNTDFFSFFLLCFFFLLEYLLHKGNTFGSYHWLFCQWFLPAQAVFSWLRMLLLVSYRWGWQCCTNNEWIRLCGGMGDCWDLFYTRHVSLCYWWYSFPCVLFLPRGKLIKEAYIFPELRAALVTKDSCVGW